MTKVLENGIGKLKETEISDRIKMLSLREKGKKYRKQETKHITTLQKKEKRSELDGLKET